MLHRLLLRPHKKDTGNRVSAQACLSKTGRSYRPVRRFSVYAHDVAEMHLPEKLKQVNSFLP